MSTTFSNLLYHIIFSTKDRAPSIQGDLQGRLYAYLGGILSNEGGILLEVGGMPDHVHLLAKLRTDHSVADIVRLIKANSSRWMNREYPAHGRFEWQAGYGAFSVSTSKVDVLRRYIRNQADHHARTPFREELIELLNRHGIEYDERYLLG
jgi:REP element-mobilizing transposase RayT